ncbi:PT domain-containing protein [Streptomyces sp. MspMP-M5]|uniref:PT domain-containing protein n=1 Tax=unclassified Streptomyces TaxID=2593676 RepID=UPI0003A05C45|nr:PT domain-containing protein [Streptomyces sp. MspMP-M5]
MDSADTSGASQPEPAGIGTGREDDGPGREGDGSGRAQARLVLTGGLCGAVLLVASLVVDLSGSNELKLPQMPKLPSLPTAPGSLPTDMPTNFPTGLPTGLPTDLPTDLPTGFPTGLPTNFPSLPPLPTGLTGGGS